MRFTDCDLQKSTVRFYETYAKEGIYFDKYSYPDTVKFEHLKFIGEIEFEPSQQSRKTVLMVGNDFPINKLRINASNFAFVFDTTMNRLQIEFFYRKLLQEQKMFGSDNDVASIDIRLKDEEVKDGNVFLWLQKYLWQYGYNKYLLLKRLMIFLGVFFIVNLFIFRILINRVYIIQPIRIEYVKLKTKKWLAVKIVRYVLLVFLYTNIIFFGIKMDINNFFFRYLLAALYIFTFYLLGLVFLFYSVGLVLAK